MTREEKCILAIEKGFTYDKETGIIYGIYGKIYNRKCGDGYIAMALYVNSKRFHLRGHQFAWYITNRKIVEQIDHINGIRDDNRICNLREVTHQQNQWNTNAKGYSKRPNGRWQVRIRIEGKESYLGVYDTEEEARKTYLDAKKLYHII